LKLCDMPSHGSRHGLLCCCPAGQVNGTKRIRIMANEKERAWFQIHLSTAIYLVLVAGALLGLNMHRRHLLIFSQEGDAFGWPLPFVAQKNFMKGGYEWRFHESSLLIDIMVWGFLLLFVLGFNEYLIHRREALKQ
jgi:hypothetical protein